MSTLDYHGGIQAITFLGDCPSFKNIVALWNFNIGVNEKPKMWNISKTVYRKAKTGGNWDPGYHSAHM